MESLSDCLELVHSTWLAISISSCFRKPQDGGDKPEPVAPGIIVGNTEVCCEQPTPHPPPEYILDHAYATPRSSLRLSTSYRPSSSLRQRQSAGFPESRMRTSRVLSRISFTSRRSTPRRPTIGAPSEFRRVQSGRISPLRRTLPFRPLQLSIYLPGNELPELPIFWEDGADEVEGVILEQPAQALKSRSDSMLLGHPSSSFSIPRKPLPSRTSSLNTSRFSMDSQFTLNWVGGPSKSQSIDHLRSKSIERRPSFITTRSAQDFLDALDARDAHLPQPPPAATRSNSEPPYTIYRRASEQSLRLRTHLEERQSLEGRLLNCATIQEEISPLSPRPGEQIPLSPISDRDNNTDNSPCEDQLIQGDVHAEEPVVSQARSSSGSSTLLNPPTPLLNPSHTDTAMSDRPMVATTISANTHASFRDRFSQWILKALPTLPHSSASLDLYDTSGPTEFNSIQSSPSSHLHTKQSSMSSYWTLGGGRGASFDVEKTSIPPQVSSVGVAF